MARLPAVHGLDEARREEILLRLERITELPLLMLAFLMIPLLVGPFFWDLSEEEQAAFRAMDAFIWAVFAVDLLVKVAITRHKVAYLRRHWLEVLIVVVPFFRPLRLLRLFLLGSHAFVGVRRLVHVDFLVVYGVGLVMVASTVVLSLERNTDGANITTFGDALWWAVVTVTTVGYGDTFPISVGGRAMAFVLMLGGIAFYSGLTANLASVLSRTTDPQPAGLDRLTREIEALRQEVASLRSEGQPGEEEAQQ